MNWLLRFLTEYAGAITALATCIIALFTVLMWFVTRRIESATRHRDKEMTELYLVIVSTILVSGRTVGEPELSIRLIEEQKEKLGKLLAASNNAMVERGP